MRGRSSRPRLLDLFCGEGGAAMGYHRAGFEVTGVDLAPMKAYPFQFVEADALEYLAEHGREFDAIHASPPCQAYSEVQSANKRGHMHPRLIADVRAGLLAAGRPYVIENVDGARRELIEPGRLCGEMFGLSVIRHRLFETSWSLTVPEHVKHRGRVRGWRAGVYHDGPYLAVYGEGGGKGTTAEWSAAMGIDWMSRDGLREAIPPAYSEWIGGDLLHHALRYLT